MSSWRSAARARRPPAGRMSATRRLRASPSIRHKSTRTDDRAAPDASMRAFYNRCSLVGGAMAIRVMHVGLGPIGAAVARQLARRKGFQIVGAVDIDPHEGGQGRGRRHGARTPAAREGHRRHRQDDQGHQAGRRGAVHQLVAEGRDAAVRGGAEAPRADRHDDRGGRVSGAAQPAAWRSGSTRRRARRRWRCSAPASTRASRWTRCRSR